MPVAERLSPDAILASSGLSGAVSAIQDDPDSADANWLTAAALATIGSKTYYLLDSAVADNDFGALQDGGAAPAVANLSTSWAVGTLAATRYASMDRGAQVSRTATNATFGWITTRPTHLPDGTRGTSFRTGPLNGSFANANWTFTFGTRSLSGTAHRGRVMVRVFRGSNPDGSDAVQIGTFIDSGITGAMSTTAVNNVVATFAPGGTVTMINEYLFFDIAWVITTAGGANTAAVALTAGASSLVTSAFTPVEPTTSVRVSFPSPARALTSVQNFRARVRRKTTANATGVPYSIQAYQNGVPVGSPSNGVVTAETVIEHNSTTLTDETAVEFNVSLSGVAQNSGEVGAIEWNATIIDAAINTVRTAASWFLSAAGQSNRNVSRLRTVAAWFNAASQSNRTASKLRTVASWLLGASQGKRTVNRPRSISSWFTAASETHRAATQKVRNVQSWLNASGVSNRSTSLQRSVAAWMNAYSEAHALVNRVRSATSVLSGAAGSAFRSSQQYRTAISHLINATSTANRVINRVRNAESVAFFAGVAQRVQQHNRVVSTYGRFESWATTLTNSIIYRTATSFIRAAGEATRELENYRKAESYLRAIGEAFRTTDQERTDESSGGFGASATVMRASYRSATSAGRFGSESHFSTGPEWFPFEGTSMVISVLPKRQLEIEVQDKKDAVINIAPKREMQIKILTGD